jgi:23S rRNA pseudouridine1911/1915/1917 synthase
MSTATHSRARRLVAERGSDRLDLFVEAQCPELSRSRCTHLVKEGWVLLNGHTAKPSRPVRPGDVVDVTVPPPPSSELVAQEMPLAVVYQDDDVLVVDKPAGLTVHPGPGHPDSTLVNALLALVPNLAGIGSSHRPGIVHRLDKATSGIMVVAKTAKAYASLTRQLKERRVSKTYVAMVNGTVSRDKGDIDAPIARHPRHRQRMAVVPAGRDALTRFSVKTRYQDYTLVEAYPVTGRTHQVRVHFAHIGHPLVGDVTYGKASGRHLVTRGRHFLHAARLGFHLPPGDQEWREFEAPLPEDLQAALVLLGSGTPA